MKKILVFLMVLTLCSCMKQSGSHKYTIHQYAQHRNTSGSDDMLYWYIIWTNNSGSAYYYTSPTPVNNFTNIPFVSTQQLPVKIEELDDEGSLLIDESQLEEEVSANLEQEATTESDNGDGTTEAESSSDDSSSSDSGGDGGGGGDGGD